MLDGGEILESSMIGHNVKMASYQVHFKVADSIDHSQALFLSYGVSGLPWHEFARIKCHRQVSTILLFLAKNSSNASVGGIHVECEWLGIVWVMDIYWLLL